MIRHDDRGDRGHQRRDPRWTIVAMTLALTLALGVAAGVLGLWSLGHGLTTPGGEADTASEILGATAVLAGIGSLAAAVVAIGVAGSGWPLPGRFWRGLLIAVLAAAGLIAARVLLGS